MTKIIRVEERESTTHLQSRSEDLVKKAGSPTGVLVLLCGSAEPSAVSSTRVPRAMTPKDRSSFETESNYHVSEHDLAPMAEAAELLLAVLIILVRAVNRLPMPLFHTTSNTIFA